MWSLFFFLWLAALACHREVTVVRPDDLSSPRPGPPVEQNITAEWNEDLFVKTLAALDVSHCVDLSITGHAGENLLTVIVLPDGRVASAVSAPSGGFDQACMSAALLGKSLVKPFRPPAREMLVIASRHAPPDGKVVWPRHKLFLDRPTRPVDDDAATP
jgi:hypothetical protein